MNNKSYTDEIYDTTIEGDAELWGGLMQVLEIFMVAKAFQTVDDVKGLKIRVQPSPTNIAMMDAFNAGAVPMSFSEVYTALQKQYNRRCWKNNELALNTVKHGEDKIPIRTINTNEKFDFIVSNYEFIHRLNDTKNRFFMTQ